jgi:hypothetical protein
MKERTKGFIAGVLGATMIGTAVIGVSGEQIQKAATLFYNNIKICIDGTYIEPKDSDGNKVEPFIMDGTTYLPVRAVANAFGKDVEWDGTTNTVFLGSKPGATNYSRSNPAPIGSTQSIRLGTNDADFNYYEYTAKVTLKEVFRGDEAWKMLKDANMFNSEPKEGKEYVLIKVSVSVDELSDDVSANISQAMFNFYSTDFTKYNNISLCVMPNNQNINTNVYNGGTVEGYVCKEIDVADATPTIAFGQDYSGNGGIWFSLTK